MKNFDIVNRKPLVEQNTMIPTKPNEICWDQNRTSMSKPNQCTAISIPLVMGSTLPTLKQKFKIFICFFFHIEKNILLSNYQTKDLQKKVYCRKRKCLSFEKKNTKIYNKVKTSEKYCKTNELLPTLKKDNA